MKDGRCTAEDVARAAGVSTMTVSRAMSGRPGLGPETKERVLGAAARLGYRPSKVARALASRRSSSLGIILPDIANPFFSILAKAAIDSARLSSRSVFVMNTDENPARELAAIEELRSEQIDGIVVAGSRMSEARLREALSPFWAAVLVNRDLAGPRRGSVSIDDRGGASEEVAYLVARGRRRIGLLAGPRASTSARRRLSGYRDGLARSGFAFVPDIIERCVPTIEGGAEATRALIAREPRVDAIVAYNDIAAIGSLRALEELGVSVPADVAVMGTDDIPYAALVRPSLTTVGADIPRLGASAVSLLLALGEGGSVEEPPPQSPRLVLRESA
jgi:LacI family transcriptional regulator